MKRYISLFMSIVLLFCIGACSKRKSVSDAELALIFRDAFLSNAYVLDTGLKLDSLKLYEPIFNKYGYSTKDVQNAIGSFATRKSARLSDVVEEAISILEREGKELDFEVGILDTLSNIARRRTIKVVAQDTLIELYNFKDTTKVIFVFENPKVSSYEISYDYFIDSLDTTDRGFSTNNYLEKRVTKMVKRIIDEGDELADDDDYEMVEESKNEKYKIKKSVLTRGTASTMRNVIEVDEDAERLVVKLAMPTKEVGRPHLTIKNFQIRNILSRDEAADSLYRQLLDVRIFDNELLFLKSQATDSL